MINVKDVANYFLNKNNDSDDSDVSNLKLQKLVYYAQGFYLALFDEPLYQEPLEAWTHGPVCPDLYHEYKEYGNSTIPTPAELTLEKALYVDEVELLDEIHEVFGQFSAWKLRDMTHEEKPWINHESTASVIPHNELMDYFKTRLK